MSKIKFKLITGKSERQSRNILNDIKVFYKKEKHQLVTIQEFCTYMGLNYEDVTSYLKINPKSA